MLRRKVDWNLRMLTCTTASKVVCCIARIFLVAAGTLAAQSTADWNNVKALPSGTQVRIKAGSQTVTGLFQSATEESVVLTSAKGQETFAREQIMRMGVKKASRRGRNTLIGLAAGAGLGLIAGAISDSKCAALSCLVWANFGKAVLTPAGAILGLGVGFAWPSGGWRQVYKP